MGFTSDTGNPHFWKLALGPHILYLFSLTQRHLKRIFAFTKEGKSMCFAASGYRGSSTPSSEGGPSEPLPENQTPQPGHPARSSAPSWGASVLDLELVCTFLLLLYVICECYFRCYVLVGMIW